MAQQSWPPFDEKVYALSKIVHRVKFRNNRSENYTLSQRKHLRLLDDIALLLVTESGSDVAAVSFEQRPTETIFYFATNRPATLKEHAYVKQLTALSQSSEGINRTEAIFDIVLRVCRPKMLSRYDKMMRILTKLPPAAHYFEDDTNGDLDRHFQNTLGSWYDPQAGPVAFVDTFLSHLCELGKQKQRQLPEPDALGQLIRVAHATGSIKAGLRRGSRESGVPQRSTCEANEAAGDYFGAVKRIVRSADSILGRSPRRIRFEEVCKSR